MADLTGVILSAVNGAEGVLTSRPDAPPSDRPAAAAKAILAIAAAVCKHGRLLGLALSPEIENLAHDDDFLDEVFADSPAPPRALAEAMRHFPDLEVEATDLARAWLAPREAVLDELPFDRTGRLLGLLVDAMAPNVVVCPPGGWCGPGCQMKEAAPRLGFSTRGSLKSYLDYGKKTDRDPKGLRDFFAGGPGRTLDGKFREDALAAYEAARKRLPEIARAISDGAAEQAVSFARTAGRNLPYTALESVFGQYARK